MTAHQTHRILQEIRPDGTLILTAPGPDTVDGPLLPAILETQARENGDQPFVIEPDPTAPQFQTFAEAHARATDLGRAFRGFGLSPDRPLAILSQNSITHALVSLGAMIAGVPVAPISVAYSTMPDKGRLRDVLQTLQPGLVFAEDGSAFADALTVAATLGFSTLVDRNAGSGAECPTLDTFCETHGGDDITLPVVQADTLAKIQFTSGSTGGPKGAMVTHGMMASNQQAMAAVWPFLTDTPPVLVDWLPWNHTYGGNLVFNCALFNGGTLVIDNGRPAPGLFDQTMDNFRNHPPVVHFGVPRGFAMLVPALEADDTFAGTYFSRLRAMFTAGAALPRDLWDRYRRLARQHGRPDLQVHIGWGATETSPVASISPAASDRHNNIGVPIPGASIKMAPNDGKMELRVRGPMVMPGYWKRPELSRDAFDDEGYYVIGDAGVLLDPERPEKGILFDGRVAENFKLTTGTWVQVTDLRLAAIDRGAPVIQDAVITGHDRDEIGMLVFLNLDGARQVAGDPTANLAQLAENDRVRGRIRDTLAGFAGESSSSRIRRALILPDAPSVDAGEMTDKGYLNQRAALAGRAAAVERLHARPTDPGVILP